MQVYGTVDGSVCICASKTNDILTIVFTFVLGSFLKGKWSFQVSQEGQSVAANKDKKQHNITL